MSRREQLQRIRKQLEDLHGDPIANAIGKVMDECEAGAWEPTTHMTWEELEAAEADTAELLALLEGAKPALSRIRLAGGEDRQKFNQPFGAPPCAPGRP